MNDDPTEPTEPITDPVNPTEPPRLPPPTTWDPPGDGQTIDRVPPVVDPPDESIGE